MAIEGHDLRAIAPVEYAAPKALPLLAELIAHTDVDIALEALLTLVHDLLVERRKCGLVDSLLEIPPARDALVFAA
jgi:hypothetical protein